MPFYLAELTAHFLHHRLSKRDLLRPSLVRRTGRQPWSEECSYEHLRIDEVFGDNLKKYRTAMGISQEAFAEKCGMHRTYISAIECYRRSISLENIQRIADALEIETYKLFLED